MLDGQLRNELKTPKEWDCDLTDYEYSEVEALAIEKNCSFGKAFDMWLEQVNKQNADMWELEL